MTVTVIAPTAPGLHEPRLHESPSVERRLCVGAFERAGDAETSASLVRASRPPSGMPPRPQ
ncbi:hypothetical protein, partial [Streptomyces sp. LMG1-1-1.1]|uniref:hypothetical protein n=1 Tax=Streptomyces sp. LMG1-1-1.1 TaxID=3135245 RepID=UPI003466D880